MTMSREKLCDLLWMLDNSHLEIDDAIDSMSTKIAGHYTHQEGDLSDVKVARDSLRKRHDQYLESYYSISNQDREIPLSDNELRVLQNSARGLVAAMEELAQFDNTIAPDLTKLKAKFVPLLLGRVDKYRAEVEVKASQVIQR